MYCSVYLLNKLYLQRVHDCLNICGEVRCHLLSLGLQGDSYSNQLVLKKIQYKLVHIEENHPLVCFCRREAMVGLVVDPVCGGILSQ